MLQKYFSEFYLRVFPHLSACTAVEFYREVFSWYRGDPESEEGGKTIENDLLDKWARGDRYLPRKILLQALNSPNLAAEQYDPVFQNLRKDLEKTAPSSYDMLLESIEQLEKDYPISVDFDYKYDPVAKAFTTALVCDGILSEERLLEAGLRRSIKKAINECKKNNHAFSMMYILSILLKPPYRLLGHMLEESPAKTGQAAGLKAKWIQLSEAYAAKPDHKGYLPIELEDIELLQWAKLLAYSPKDGKAGIAGELEVCKAIFRCEERSSNALSALRKDMGPSMDPAAWDRLAEACCDAMYKTTIG